MSDSHQNSKLPKDDKIYMVTISKFHVYFDLVQNLSKWGKNLSFGQKIYSGAYVKLKVLRLANI